MANPLTRLANRNHFLDGGAGADKAVKKNKTKQNTKKQKKQNKTKTKTKKRMPLNR